MLAEVSVFGVYVSPLSVYMLAALLITLFLRFILWHAGILQWFWHIALFEIALYCCTLSLLILFL